MEIYRIDYIRGGMCWKTSPWYSNREECIREAQRFNALPMMSLERGAMTARIVSDKVDVR